MPNSIQSVLELKNYSVKKINFELNNSFNFSKSQEIKICPQFNRNIKKIDDDIVAVGLSINIGDSFALPFFVNIEIEGVFKLKEWEKDNNRVFIEKNAVAILFPYLRTLVTMVTANSNLNPYILPIMNIADMFDTSNKI